MKITQRNAGAAREAHIEMEEGWGSSIILLIALNVAAIVGAVWLVLSVPEALERAADAQVAATRLTDDATIDETYQVNATKGSFALPLY